MNRIKKAYRQSQLEGLPPERITLMLFEGAVNFINAAREATLRGDAAVRGERISRALAIVGELQATLNFEAGGEIAQNLMVLYEYLTRELLLANLRADVELMAHLAEVLDEIRAGWAEMVEQVAASRADGGKEPTASGDEAGTYA